MPRMRARILAVGDELLLGRTVDTNSSYIARWLTDRGFHVDRSVVVGDPQIDIEKAMDAVCGGASLVIVTGGLGPTDDDRTRHALAAVMGVSLIESIVAWKKIVQYYKNNLPNTPIPEVNKRQAQLPRGAKLLDNDRGTAPGIIGRVGNCRVACLPGVPHEMYAMLDRLDTYLPTWFARLQPPYISEVWFAGIGESAAQEHIGDLLTENNPRVGITVSEQGHITLRVVGTAIEVQERIAALKKVLKPWLLPAAGLAPSLVRLLGRRRQTITTAESCTCGHVVAKLGAVPGASAILRESLIAYHEQVKSLRLHVTPACIKKHGIVSEAVAAAMAVGMRKHAKADYAIATTGVAGPSGGTPSTPVGTVCFAVADAQGVVTRMIRVRGGRERVQTRAAAHALVLAYEVAAGRVRTKSTHLT